MATVSSAISTKTYTLGSRTKGPFLVGYRIFDDAEAAMRVYINGALTPDYTLTATFVDGYSDGAEILLDDSQPAGTKVTIESVTPYARQSNFVNGDPSLTRKLNIEQGRQAGFDRDVRRDVDRSVKTALGAPPVTLPEGEPDKVLMWDDEGENLINGPDGNDLANAAAYAAQAQAAAAAALALSPNAFVENVAALVANTTFTYTVGEAGTVVVGNTIMTRQEGFSYQVVSAGATNQHLTTAGGVKVRVRVQSSVADLRAFNADNTGVVSASPQFQMAVDLLASTGGGTLFVSQGTYSLTASTQLATGVSIVSLGAVLEQKASNLQMFRGTGVQFSKIIGFTVRNPNGYASGQFVDLTDCTQCEIEENRLFDCPSSNGGSITITGVNGAAQILVKDNFIESSKGVGIGLVGNAARNRIESNYIYDCASEGIMLYSGAIKNTISRNYTPRNGAELVKAQWNCVYNIIEANHAEDCGQNGISIIGDYNVVTGNHCRQNANDGIRLNGSNNAATGNVCLSNGQVYSTACGLRIWPKDGGCGQNNLVVGNLIDDGRQAVMTQYIGIGIIDTAYAVWSAGEAITSGEFRVNGLRLFVATTSGTTGSTAPVHGSGTASDGGVTWERIGTFQEVADVYGNIVMANRLGFSVSGTTIQDEQDPEYGPVEQAAANMKFNRGVVWARRLVTGSTFVTDDDYIIAVRSSSDCEIMMPPPTRLTPGRAFIVKNELGSSSGNITINGNGNLIGGSATRVISENYGEVRLYWAEDRWAAT
jgi:hypothetical protein